MTPREVERELGTSFNQRAARRGQVVMDRMINSGQWAFYAIDECSEGCCPTRFLFRYDADGQLYALEAGSLGARYAGAVDAAEASHMERHRERAQ